MTDFRRIPGGKLPLALFIFTLTGLSQTKISLRQLDANGFSNGCVVATSSRLSTQACGSGTATGDGAGYTVVSFSSTPIFPVTKNTGQSFLLTLTADVASSTTDTTGITNSGRPMVTFRLCQDGSGSHVFAWPTSVLNHGTVDPTPNSCSTQTFVFDGTNFQPLGNLLVTGVSGDGVTLPGSTTGTTKLQASPAASGTLTLPARTATLATTLGTSTTGHCAQYDSSGNLVDSGTGCGSGIGGSSVTPNPPFLLTVGSANYVMPYMTQQRPFSTTGYSVISGSPTITTLSNGVVTITTSDASTDTFYGRTLAGTENSLVAGLAGGCLGGDYGEVSIYVGEITSNSLYRFGLACGSGSTMLEIAKFTLTGTYSGSLYTHPSNFFANPAYFKIDWTSSNVNFSVSFDGGASWDLVYAATTSALFGSSIKPTAVGMAVTGSSGTAGTNTTQEIIHYALQ